MMCVGAYGLIHGMKDLGLAKETEVYVTVKFTGPILTGCYSHILIVY
jgi:hypothetical protein